MLFQLVKKDFLIVKKYVLIMFAVCILFPVFLLWRSPEYAGILGFVLITIFSIFMLLQYVSLKETQYPKASTLLCALPFSRKNIVLSKYIFCILIYLACCLIFGIETLIFPQLRSIGYKVPILLFMVVSLFLGVYLPAQYKLGYEKTKLFYQLVDMPELEGNYLETSGSAMIAYAILKGCRLGILQEEKWRRRGEEIFDGLEREKLQKDEDGWHLTGICLVAGLGPKDERDGSVEYYLSEPVVSDEEKGVGVFMMAYGEYLKLEKQDEA